MEIDEQKIEKGIELKIKPDKYSLSQNSITLVSNASEKVQRDGYSFLGWVKTDKDCNPETTPTIPKYNYIKRTYSTDKDNEDLYFVATWSLNKVNIKDLKITILDEEREMGVEKVETRNYENFINDKYDIDLMSTINPNIELKFHTNVVTYETVGMMDIECENAVVKDKNFNVLNKLILTNDSSGVTLNIVPTSLGKFTVKIKNPVKDNYFKNPIIFSGEYTLPYKKIIFNDIEVDDKKSFIGTYKKDESKVDLINFNTCSTEHYYNVPTPNIDNTDLTGRDLIGYKNKLFLEDLSDTHLIKLSDTKVSMKCLGNPNTNGEVYLCPLYTLRNYNILYSLDNNPIVFSDDNPIFPSTFNADNHKSIGDLVGLDKYYKLVDGKYILTDYENADINTIYIRDTNIKTTVPAPASPFKDIDVKLFGSNAYPYKVYSSSNLIYNKTNPFLVGIKGEASKLQGDINNYENEAVSDTSEVTKNGVYFLKDGESIILEPPVESSKTYEEDNENFVFGRFYEATTNKFVDRDEATGKFIFPIKGNEVNELKFYALWDFEELIEAYINNDDNIESIIIE